MEFKKTNRSDKERLAKLGIPQRPTAGAGASVPQQAPIAESASTASISPAHHKKTPLTKVRQFIYANKITTVTCIVVVVIIGSVVHYYTSKGSSDPTGSVNVPQYQTVIPDGTSIAQLGGWKRISPPENDPVFAYSDKIGGVAIAVSQQPLPASFKGSTASSIAELAKSYNATVKVEAKDITAYVGTSAKGPQSVIFTKNNLLILIKSQQKVSNDDWSKYIASLNTLGEVPKY